MNIFSALSQGKGKLNEENLSAMLGFLLKPTNEHGLSDLFLKRFLKIVCDEIHYDYSKIINKNYTLDVTFESPYVYQNKIRRIDLDLKFYLEDEEVLRILIENKIRTNAAEEFQFFEEYVGVLSNLEDEEQLKTDVIMVFLTHSSEDSKLVNEFEALTSTILQNNHHKRWIYWDDSNNENTVTHVLKGILIDESMVVIDPISEYIRHTIKAFVCFIQENMVSVKQASIRHNPLDNDTLKENYEIIVGGKRYSLELYKSSAIKVYDIEADEYVPAKKILRWCIQEYNLKIEVMRNETKEKTTRQLGKEIINCIDEIKRGQFTAEENQLSL